MSAAILKDRSIFMNTEKYEQELRQLFNELRAADEQCIPSFGRFARERPSDKSPGRSILRLRWLLGPGAVALLIAGIALAASQLREHRAKKELQQWAALSDWAAQTDGLLGVSASFAGGEVIAPTDSLLEHSTESIDANPKHL